MTIGRDVSLDELPLRDDLVAAHPMVRRNSSVPVQINTNENPFPPGPALTADITAVGPRAPLRR